MKKTKLPNCCGASIIHAIKSMTGEDFEEELVNVLADEHNPDNNYGEWEDVLIIIIVNDYQQDFAEYYLKKYGFTEVEEIPGVHGGRIYLWIKKIILD